MRRTLAGALLIASIPALALTGLPTAAAGPEGRADRASMAPRPTDGNHDPQGDGYKTKQVKKKCSPFLCLHWVTKSKDLDKPPPGWADTTLRHLNRAWRKEVQQMGFRKPLGDGTRGGNSKLDVYLKDIGWKGQDGYCKKDRNRYVTSGYCVLDNDFLDPELDATDPEARLKVTIARELFHVIQFAYDAEEDGWLKDSTARWMEERFADSVNDNRKYLLDGQLGAPNASLDTNVEGGPDQYGNWIFWEYLTQRKGNGLVKQVWEKAAAGKGKADLYSTQALKAVLKKKGGFKNNFAGYANALTLPAKFWAEGSAWPGGAPMTYTHNLNAGSGQVTNPPVGLNHMTSRNVRFTTSSSNLTKGYRLKVSVDGPSSKTSPAAFLLVQKADGSIVRKAISLNASGNGSATVGFDDAGVTSVTLTMVNASTRFTCWKSTQFSCSGLPKDEIKPFSYTGTVLAPAS